MHQLSSPLIDGLGTVHNEALLDLHPQTHKTQLWKSTKQCPADTTDTQPTATTTTIAKHGASPNWSSSAAIVYVSCPLARDSQLQTVALA